MLAKLPVCGEAKRDMDECIFMCYEDRPRAFLIKQTVKEGHI